MKKLLLLFIMSGVFIFCSCKKSDSNSTNVEDVEVYLKAGKDSNGDFFYLAFRTITDYSCANYRIATSENNELTDFSIHLKEIVAPDVCLTAFGPASAKWELPELKDGIYPISIKISSYRANKGKLIVAGNKYELQMETERKLQFPNGKSLQL
jgi:hypothetical protein